MELIYPVPKNEVIRKETFAELGEIQSYFRNSTIFVTGATGFLGSLLVEKLLRSCPDIEKIYIMMRPKKDESAEKRFLQYFDRPIFERVKNENSKALAKVEVLLGDCAQPELGLSNRDKEVLIAEVNCIVHLAATVRFDETLRTALLINTRATRDLIRIAKDVKKLTSMVHISTAYSNCPYRNIEETFYKTEMAGSKLLSMLDLLDNDLLDKMTPSILGKWPNTYVFTKSIAEEIVQSEGKGLPLAVLRPSIVIGTAKDPIPGWIDNYYGAAGIIAGVGVGLIRSLHCKKNNIADMVPADYVVNSILAAAWNTSKVCKSSKRKFPELEIYNYVSGPENPITWSQTLSYGHLYGNNVATVFQIWHPFLILTSRRFLHVIFHCLLHLFPAYLADLILIFFGKKPRLVNGYRKVSKMLNVIMYFSSQQWTFDNDNTRRLWRRLSPEDRKVFPFSMKELDWKKFFETFIPGIRVYVLKDPLETVPQGLARRRKMQIAHYFIVMLLALLSLKIITMAFYFFLKF